MAWWLESSGECVSLGNYNRCPHKRSVSWSLLLLAMRRKETCAFVCLPLLLLLLLFFLLLCIALDSIHRRVHPIFFTSSLICEQTIYNIFICQRCPPSESHHSSSWTRMRRNGYCTQSGTGDGDTTTTNTTTTSHSVWAPIIISDFVVFDFLSGYLGLGYYLCI